MNLPNRLTVLRFLIAAAFLCALLNYQVVEWLFVGLLLFVGAGLTDLYDGIIARRYDLETDFGRLMDPLADKVITIVAFVYFIRIPELAWPAWLVVILIVRELSVNTLRTLAAVREKVLAAASSGKYKTAVQIAGIFLILLGLIFYRLNLVTIYWLNGVSWTVMFLILILTVYSGFEYYYNNWEIFSQCMDSDK